MISVIIPCYNQSKFLDYCLKSILHQTFSDWECIIIDDGSLDNTKSIAKFWCNKDQRFSYFFQENSGLSSARNLGLEKASGDYIQFLDADDFLDKRKFELSLSFLIEKEPNLIITNFRTFENNIKNSSAAFCKLTKKELNYKKVLFEWDENFNIPIHCGLFPKKLIGDIRFQENLKAKEDWVFWLMIFQKKDVKPIFIDKPLAYYRMHSQSMTKKLAFMVCNRAKAIEYLSTVIPQEDCLEFYKKEINKRDIKINQLQNSIINHQKTRTYKLSKLIKNLLKLP